VPPNLSWGDSRLYAVLQSTLDKDYRQAEEPKQLVDEASQFNLGRQRQHSAVICSGALLFSSRVLCPSLVTLSAHTSQVDVQLNSTMRKWRLTDTDLCPCGETQTMSHIVESCPLTKLNGGLFRLHSADKDAVSWLTSLHVRQFPHSAFRILPVPAS